LAPVIVVIVTVNIYLFRRRIPEHERMTSSHERLPSLRELIVLTGAQYSTLLITVISSSLVSLVVIDRLGAVASAHYYLPAQIAGGAAVALWSVDQAFLVEASSEQQALRHHARVALRAGIAIVVITLAVGETFAPEILRIFGAAYAAKGTTLMRLMLLSLPGSGIIAFYSAFAWLDRKVWSLTVRECISTAVYFILIFTLIGHFGILAIGISALITSCVQGVLFLPLMIRRYQRAVRDGVADFGSGVSADPGQ
jgi:O-antigen/teichoic acid export membrane protein